MVSNLKDKDEVSKDAKVPGESVSDHLKIELSDVRRQLDRFERMVPVFRALGIFALIAGPAVSLIAKSPQFLIISTYSIVFFLGEPLAWAGIILWHWLRPLARTK